MNHGLALHGAVHEGARVRVAEPLRVHTGAPLRVAPYAQDDQDERDAAVDVRRQGRA